MGSCSNGSPVPGSRLFGHVALVSYIPDPLGSFLDGLCRELVPAAKPHAHVSILPPRPLPCEPDCAAAELRKLLEDIAPFDLVLGDVQIFPVSHVIYVSIAHGKERLRQLHNLLNKGLSKYTEVFPYHPHVTLAQELSEESAQSKVEIARRRWMEYPHSRVVHIDALSFVQNQNCDWIDLLDIRLSGQPVLA